jgi:Vacuolar protein sorting-associated protein 62
MIGASSSGEGGLTAPRGGDPLRRRGLFERFKRAAWWVHVVATLGAVLLVLLVAAALAGVLFVDYVRERGPLASDAPTTSAVSREEHTELVRRFAPVLRYHSQELFLPILRASYIKRTELKESEGRFTRLLSKIADPDRLPAVEGSCLRVRGCLYFLDVRGVEPDPPKDSQKAYDAIENTIFRNGARPAVYAHVTRYDDTGHYAVQYWFLYFFNFRLNEHESDWEQVTVHLDADKNPVDVFYSAHEGGEIADWNDVERDGEHPVVYPALGSHANYFTAGRHPVKVGCKRVIGSIKRCLRGRKILVDVADGKGRELKPADYDLTEFAGPIFFGSYGSGNYVVLTRQPSVLNDPRLRSLWADPLRPLR